MPGVQHGTLDSRCCIQCFVSCKESWSIDVGTRRGTERTREAENTAVLLVISVK